MKTTIEIHGYEIVIEEKEEGLVSVSALKDGETIEEFELEGGEDHPGFEGEEDDFDSAEEMGEEEEEMGEEEEEMGEEEEEEGEEAQEEGKLESFNSFIKKRK